MAARVRRLTSLFTLMFRPSAKMVRASRLARAPLPCAWRPEQQSKAYERTRSGRMNGPGRGGRTNPGAVACHGRTEGHDVPLRDRCLRRRAAAVDGRFPVLDNDNDPVLLREEGSAVDTWRQGCPYSERMDRGDYELGKRVLRFSSSGSSTRYASGGAPPPTPASLDRSVSSSSPPRTRPRHHPNPVGGTVNPMRVLLLVELFQACSPLDPRAVTSPPVRTEAGVGTGANGCFEDRQAAVESVTGPTTAEAPSWPSWARVGDAARCRWPASAAVRGRFGDDDVRPRLRTYLGDPGVHRTADDDADSWSGGVGNPLP